MTTHQEGVIEDAEGALQVDFANQFIGGGVISGGCVQEEILFAVCPELICAMVFCPRMLRYECIFISGCERFSGYKGYAFSLEYAGDFQDKTKRLPDGSLDKRIVALDATDYRMGGPAMQFCQQHYLRDLEKAYVGFAPLESETPPLAPVSTGNWVLIF